MGYGTKSPGNRANIKKEDTTFPVSENGELMKFLIARLPGKSRNNIKSLLANKQVSVNGKPVKQFNHPLTPGQQVEIRWDRVPEEKKYRGITLIYEDTDIIVIDKHAGMLSIATNKDDQQTALKMLTIHQNNKGNTKRIFAINRLDRETSGLMIFAKSERVQKVLMSRWNDITSGTTYIAVVEGIPGNSQGTISTYLRESKALIVYSSHNPENGEKAVTHYKVFKSGKGYAMLKVNLETGRKNQLRVHMKDIGHPVVGDKKYGSKIDSIGRLALHAWSIAFDNPLSGKPIRFETSIPRKFMRLI